MTISRKEFFRQGFFALGDTLLKAGETVKDMRVSLMNLPVETELDMPPVADENKVASVSNSHCLAKNCGCFTCVERCEAQAIQMVMGEGVRIDTHRCRGCGTCAYVCPVTPKALTLIKREAK